MERPATSATTARRAEERATQDARATLRRAPLVALLLA